MHNNGIRETIRGIIGFNNLFFYTIMFSKNGFRDYNSTDQKVTSTNKLNLKLFIFFFTHTGPKFRSRIRKVEDFGGRHYFLQNFC